MIKNRHRRTPANIWRLLSIAIGTFFVLAAFALIIGYPFTLYKTWGDTFLPSLIADEIPRRIVRFIFIRIPELLLYGYMGVLTFRYVARLCPINKTAFDTYDSLDNYFLSRLFTIILAASSIAFIGVISYPKVWLFPFIIFMASLLFCVFLRYFEGLYSMRGRLLYLRRFGSFSDRAIINTVTRSSHRANRGIMYLIPKEESTADWDPWISVYGGLKILFPFASTPLYCESADSKWIRNVKEFIRDAGCIVIDISELSSSILEELKLVDELDASDRTIVICDGRYIDKIDQNSTSLKNYKHVEDYIAFNRSWIRAIPRMLFALLLVALGSFAGIFAVSDLFGFDIFNSWNPALPFRSILYNACILLILINAITFYISFAFKPNISRSSKRMIKKRIKLIYKKRKESQKLN